MSNSCGQCRHYRMNRYLESICSITGKNVGYMWKQDCFEPLPRFTQNDNQLAQNANKMENNANTKVCKECGRELPLDQFRPNPKCADGHINTCWDCMSRKLKAAARKEEEVIDAVYNNPETEPAKEVTRDLSIYAETALVAELRARGWDVKCSKFIEL